MSRKTRLGFIMAVHLVLLWDAAAHAEPARVSFDEALRRACARNPDAQVAMQEITRAHALIEEVRAASLPTLTAQATFTQLDSPRVSQATPPVVLAPAAQLEAAAVASLSLDPRRWAQWSQARENARVARLAATDVRRQLTITVGQVYLALATQHELVRAADNAVENAAAHVEYTRSRFKGGAGTELDFERATALWNSERALAERSRFVVVRLQEQLGTLLGEAAPIDVVDDVRLPLPPLDVSSALDTARRLRSDLHLADERLRAAMQVRQQSWTDFVPSANASFQAFNQNPPTELLPEHGWQLTVTLDMPLYDGGLRYGLLKERRALEDEARIRFDAELRLVAADVRTALAEVTRAQSTLASARDAARLDADVVRLTSISYRAGLSTNIEVIDAQMAALDADVAAAQASNEERQAELDLLLATGRLP